RRSASSGAASPSYRAILRAEAAAIRSWREHTSGTIARVRRIFIALLFASSVAAQTAAPPTDRAAMAARVRAEMQHAWRGYEQYAWSHDELRPVTKTAHDWHGSESLLMTPVDSLDTLLLMGLNDEAEKAKKVIVESLSFDKDIEVKNFEITIRILG